MGSNSSGTISDCYATGSVSGAAMTGGLVGMSSSGTISDCYATGAVTGTSNIGGLVGMSSDEISNCFYAVNADSSSYTSSSVDYYGTATETSVMKLQSTYTDWDFTATWAIDSTINDGYPYLQDNEPSE